MKVELEVHEIEKIAEQVAERLKPVLIKAKGKHDSEDILFDVSELMEYLKVSDKWVYARTRSRKIPFKKVDGVLLFRKSEIDRWIEEFNSPASG